MALIDGVGGGGGEVDPPQHIQEMIHTIEKTNGEEDSISCSLSNISARLGPGTSEDSPSVLHYIANCHERRIELENRLKRLYPAVNQTKTPLPRCWSSKVKYTYIGLSRNNLRVHYKGHGKTHRDAASVQATFPVPVSCGLYYYEVRIVSKGRDGYMGIGLSAAGVNMNRLPGWDKQSYGYHGDDGHSFCSSGTGQPYGPTFTTGDVIGCGLNLIDNTCFYTKNGHYLGTAFTDLPTNLYPTVGLQTPGEVIDANFGQEPFVFDIYDMIRELHSRITIEISTFPMPAGQNEWQDTINKMVSSYLVHHGYSNTAEAFAKSTCQEITEDMESVRNRQGILSLLLSGRVTEAIESTRRLYPGLLENNETLMFLLKYRQFVEMVNACDVDACYKNAGKKSSNTNSTLLTALSSIAAPNPTATSTTNSMNSSHSSSSSSHCATPIVGGGQQQSPRSSSPAVQMSVIQSTKNFTSSNNNNNNTNSSCSENNSSSSSSSNHTTIHSLSKISVEEMNKANTAYNNSGSGSLTGPVGATITTPLIISSDGDADVEMAATNDDTGLAEEDNIRNGHGMTGAKSSTENSNSGACAAVATSCNGAEKMASFNANGYQKNGEDGDIIIDAASDHQQCDGNNTNKTATPPDHHHQSEQPQNFCDIINEVKDEEMDVDVPVNRRYTPVPEVERILQFGKELHTMGQRIATDEYTKQTNREMLQNAFTLLAYAKPSTSPVGWQLDQLQREKMCASLNSAILESLNMPRRSPLEMTIGHTQELLYLMGNSGLGACAFARLNDYVDQ